MVEGPEPVMVHVCHLAGLHKIPVGNSKVNEYIDEIPAKNSEIRKYMSDTHSVSCLLSHYGSRYFI